MTRKNMHTPATWVQQRIHIVILAGIFLLAILDPFPHTARAATGDWTTYLYNNAHSGFNSTETIINPSTAPNLKLIWTHVAPGGSIFSQPAVANGIAYWGSLDGYEHATDIKTNAKVWATYLGKTTGNCGGTNGVASSSTIATVNIGGTLTAVDFVSGGNANFYALNAATGVILWHTSLGSSPSHFLWSSPAFYNGSIYIGVASLGDCPLVQGQMVQMNASTGAIQHIFNTVPNGCTGAGVWGSPTIDESSGLLFFVTGNAGSCSSPEPMSVAIIKLRASDLSYQSSWQVPPGEETGDGDFGSTPTLFTATINGTLTQMVGVPNKNGIFYAFNRNLIHVGPVWRATLAKPGACPTCGDGSISPAAWDGTTLYVAGGNTTIGGSPCQGSLRAVDPATGHFIWEHCMRSGPVLGAVTAVPGVVVVGEGTYVIVVDAVSSQTLFRFDDTNSGSRFYGPASISNGMMYIGNMDDNLYAFGL